MIELHIAEIIFIKSLLENELMNLELKRSKTTQVYAYDLTYKERMEYLTELIDKFNNYLKDKYELK